MNPLYVFPNHDLSFLPPLLLAGLYHSSRALFPKIAQGCTILSGDLCRVRLLSPFSQFLLFFPTEASVLFLFFFSPLGLLPFVFAFFRFPESARTAFFPFFWKRSPFSQCVFIQGWYKDRTKETAPSRFPKSSPPFCLSFSPLFFLPQNLRFSPHNQDKVAFLLSHPPPARLKGGPWCSEQTITLFSPPLFLKKKVPSPCTLSSFRIFTALLFILRSTIVFFFEMLTVHPGPFLSAF